MRRSALRVRVRLTTAAALTALSMVGCNNGVQKRIAPAEPALSGQTGTDTTVTVGSPDTTTKASWTDQHPLFSKPREYYANSTSKNKFVKGATATFVGVPAGFVGELKQMVRGREQAPE